MDERFSANYLKEKLILCYLSGPVDTFGSKYHNFKIFEKATDLLCKKGFSVFNPLEGEDYKQYLTVDEYFDILREDVLDLLRDCEALILLKNWEFSYGATTEKLIAERLRFPIYYIEELLNESELRELYS